jgi:hypothetical protein
MSAGADFVVDRTTPTPAQFDTSTALATMAALQRALGNYSGSNLFTTSQTLTAANAGKISNFNSASAMSCTLPVLSTVPVGTAFPIENAGAGLVTIQAQGSDGLYFLGSGINSSKTMGGGDTALVVNLGTGSWNIVGGSIQHGVASVFGSSLASNGYQKIPGGLIIQWGVFVGSASTDTTVTFPIAFPNGVSSITTSTIGVGSLFFAGYNTLTVAGFKGCTYSATSTRGATNATWMAIGY